MLCSAMIEINRTLVNLNFSSEMIRLVSGLIGFAIVRGSRDIFTL